MKPHSLVYLKFWDHCMGTADSLAPIECEVFGILKGQDDLAYYVISWICEANLSDPDSEGYCILKSTVVKLKVLDEGGRHK
jgi:hypothetical protein